MTTPANSCDLEALRAQMEEINHALLDLLNRRAGVAVAIQKIKSRDGIPTRVPARELAMLEDLAQRNRGPFSSDAVERIFREIFRASVELMEQRRARVVEGGCASRDEERPVAVNA